MKIPLNLQMIMNDDIKIYINPSAIQSEQLLNGSQWFSELTIHWNLNEAKKNLGAS